MGLFDRNRNKGVNKNGGVNAPVTDAQKLLNELKEVSHWRNSSNFNDIKNTLEKMASETNLEKKEKLNEKFGKYCEKYLKNREEAITDNTKEKLRLVEKALGYQKFMSCEIAHSQIKAMDNEKVSLESAMKITKYSKKFQDAYENFRNYPNKTGVNIDSRNQMQQQHEEHLEINVDAVRSMPKLEEAIRQNKPWGQISFPVPIVKAMEGTEKVGAVMSSRSIVTVNGKKGVFSEYSEISMEKVVENTISALPPGDIQQALGNHFEDILELCNKLKDADASKGKEGMQNEAKDSLYRFMNKKMEEGNLEEQKEKYKDLMDIMEMPEFESALSFMTEQAKGVAVIEKNRNDRELDLKKGNLDKRNELTSRMADALGLGYMVAHSERIKMVRNGKVIEGNFMEFAEGFDVNSKDPNKVKILKEAVADDAGLQRDANRIEMLDFLCGQGDRHTGNMIYTLGEPGDDGKRRITGFKAIDNDGSFLSNRTIEGFKEISYNRHIKYIPSVDKELAERIMKLNREKLEFYLGDVLDKKSLDNTVERLNEMKEHFKTCPMIEKEDWEKKTSAVKDLEKNAKGGVLWFIKTIPKGSVAFGSGFDQEAYKEKLAKYNMEKQQKEQERRERVIQNYHEKTGRAEIGKGNSEQRVKIDVNELQNLEKNAFEQIRDRKNSFHDKRARTAAPQKTQEVQKPKRAMGR